MVSRIFTQLPVVTPFHPTGSLYYRIGYPNGWMINHRFEQLVNEAQARHDELSALKEWRWLKDHEENAILLYHDLGGNLEEYTRQMATRDQMEMERQCRMIRDKKTNLDPKWARVELNNMRANRMHKLRAQEAEERARDQEMIKSDAVAQFKADVQASSDSLAGTKIITNAAIHSARQKKDVVNSGSKSSHSY